MQITGIREFLLHHLYFSKLVLIAHLMRIGFKITVVYPAILAACMVALISIQGRGFAEIPYMMLSTMEGAQQLSRIHVTTPGEVLIVHCADKPVEPSRLPERPPVCGSHTVDSISIDLLASQQASVIRATYLMLICTFVLLELSRAFTRNKRRT